MIIYVQFIPYEIEREIFLKIKFSPLKNEKNRLGTMCL